MYSNPVYSKSSARVQSALISLRSLVMRWMREGAQYNRVVQEIREVQFYGEAELAAWRARRLGRLLAHAITTVPFYRNLGISPDLASSDPVKTLADFPLIDKALVRDGGEQFLSASARKPIFRGGTSGTTGSPLVLHQDLEAISRENAFAWRQLEWAGFQRGARRAWIRGDLVVSTAVNTPPFWRLNHTERMLVMSSYHLANANSAGYIEALERFDPVMIQAYPSSIGFLAQFLEANDEYYRGAALKGIVTSSETLTSEARQLIERRFRCRVYDWYGQFERVAAIGTCEYGRKHVVSDYSYVELLPASDGLHEIVGTGFNNSVMPLIRYRTGDFVRIDLHEKRCECGRAFPLIAAIQGREDDVVKLPGGRRVGRLDHIFKDIQGVIEAQIRQDSPDRIDILVVPNAKYGPEVEQRLVSNASERLGAAVSIRVVPVTSIPRSRNGKLRGVVCNV